MEGTIVKSIFIKNILVFLALVCVSKNLTPDYETFVLTTLSIIGMLTVYEYLKALKQK